MAKMQATVDWLGKARFEGIAGSGHRLAIDGPPELGGENEGIRPMELMLLGVGGCTSFDVVNILRKSRQAITSCVAEIEAERAETEPKVFTRVHLHFRIAGRGLNPGKVERALKLSAEKYCSAAIMLERAGVAVSHDFELVDDDATATRSPRDSANAESPAPGADDATATRSPRDSAGAQPPGWRENDATAEQSSRDPASAESPAPGADDATAARSPRDSASAESPAPGADDAISARSPRDSAGAQSPGWRENDATAEQSSRDPAGAASPSRRDVPKEET